MCHPIERAQNCIRAQHRISFTTVFGIKCVPLDFAVEHIMRQTWNSNVESYRRKSNFPRGFCNTHRARISVMSALPSFRKGILSCSDFWSSHCERGQTSLSSWVRLDHTTPCVNPPRRNGRHQHITQKA